jgi:hypothetical protein
MGALGAGSAAAPAAGVVELVEKPLRSWEDCGPDATDCTLVVEVTLLATVFFPSFFFFSSETALTDEP